MIEIVAGFGVGLGLGLLFTHWRLSAQSADHFARVDTLFRNFQSERDLERKTLEGQLAAAVEERRELLTRIQAWDPGTSDKPSEVEIVDPSQEGKSTEDPGESGLTSMEIMRLHLKPNSDGGYIDVRNNALFPSVEDALMWREFMRKKGMPETTHPGQWMDDPATAVELAKLSESS